MSYIQKLWFYFTSIWLHPRTTIRKFIEDSSNRKLLIPVNCVFSIKMGLENSYLVENNENLIFYLVMATILAPIIIWLYYRTLGFLVGRISQKLNGRGSIIHSIRMVGLSYVPWILVWPLIFVITNLADFYSPKFQPYYIFSISFMVLHYVVLYLFNIWPFVLQVIGISVIHKFSIKKSLIILLLAFSLCILLFSLAGALLYRFLLVFQ